MSRDSRGLLASLGIPVRERGPVVWVVRLLAAAILASGLFITDDQVRQGLIIAVFYAAMATSYSLVIGHVRILSFAHAALVGVAAYAYALFSAELRLDVGFAMLAAIVLTGVVSAAVGCLTIRFQGFQYGVLTIALSGVFTGAVTGFPRLTGGGTGFSGFRGVLNASSDSVQQYLVAVIGYLVCAAVVLVISRTPLGSRFLAVGDDEFLAAATGLSPLKTRVQASGIAGLLAGLVGALYAQELLVVTPDSFGNTLLIDLLIIVFVGGDRTLVGLLLAAFLVKGLPVAAGFSSSWLELGSGIVLAIVLILRPAGLYPHFTRVFRTPVTRPASGSQLEPAGGVSLHVEEVVKHFGGIRALEKVSFSLHSGEIVGVVGPNGSGKTTLLNCITGVVRTTSGEVSLTGPDGRRISVSLLPTPRRTRVGIGRAFQTPRVFEGLSVADNLSVAPHAHGALWRENTRRLTEVMAKWPLATGTQSVRGLSHGRRRWVELARLEYMGCPVLLLDEPAAGLTDTERTQLIEGLNRLKTAGCAVLVVEHDLELIAEISDTVIVMNQGAVVSQGPWQALALDKSVISVIGDRLGSLPGKATLPE